MQTNKYSQTLVINYLCKKSQNVQLLWTVWVHLHLYSLSTLRWDCYFRIRQSFGVTVSSQCWQRVLKITTVSVLLDHFQQRFLAISQSYISPFSFPLLAYKFLLFNKIWFGSSCSIWLFANSSTPAYFLFGTTNNLLHVNNVQFPVLIFTPKSITKLSQCLV